MTAHRHAPLVVLAAALAAALAVPAGARAQLRELAVVPYGPERGLSGHPVTGLAQDREGRLWVGTLGGGAFVHDGLAWRSWTTRDGLLSDAVVALVPGARGEVWLSTAPVPGAEGGLSVVHRGRLLPPVEGAPWEATAGLAPAGTSEVWFALRRGGLARHDGERLEAVPGLEGVRVLRVVESRDELWLLGRPLAGDPTSPGTLHRKEKEGDAFRALGPADGLPRAPFHALLADRRGRLWLGTEAGLFVHRGARFEPARIEGVAGASARPARALAEDGEGRLWVAGDGALLRVGGDGAAVELRLPPGAAPGTPTGLVASAAGGVFLATTTTLLRLEGGIAEGLALAERAPLVGGADAAEALAREAALDAVLEGATLLLADHEGGVWAADGARVVRYAGDDARRYGRGEGLPSEDVRAVLVDQRMRVWAGTAAGVARLDPARGFFEPVSGTRDEVAALFEDRGGAVYAGTREGVLRLEGLEARPWEPARGVAPVVALAADGDGRLWMATPTAVARAGVDGPVAYGAEHGLPPSPVLALAHVAGRLWAGHERGLSRLAGERFEGVEAFADARVEGLLAAPGEGAGGVLAVTPGALRSVPGGAPVEPPVGRSRLRAALAARSGARWLALDVGLLGWDAGAEVLLAGYPFPVEGVRALAEDADGRLWLATRTGVYRHTPRARPASVWIEAVVAGGAEHAPGAPVQLPADVGEALVRWGGVSFVGPRDGADLRFESRVLPAETAWSVPARARERLLPRLRPGRYVVEVRSVSRDLRRSEPVSAELRVGVVGDPPARLVLPEVARP